MREQPLFRTFFQGGFECSSHRFPDGRTLDLLASTGHATNAMTDYIALGRLGIKVARDGMRWHLIERYTGVYDWSSFLPQVQAAHRSGAQVVWDVCHYGYPDHIDVWTSDFPERFARFAAAAARVVASESSDVPFYCPINEISYWSWAGGDLAHFGPMGLGRGHEFKRQLVRASIAAMDAIRGVDRRARFVVADPVIHVTARIPDERELVQALCATHFESWDMLAGMQQPELGGRAEYLDIVGVNYYPQNQWRHNDRRLYPGERDYRPFRDLLREVHQRYSRPVLVAETGAEAGLRAGWLRYVCNEVHAAIEAGAGIEGVCLYPVTDYPGWGDDRHCPTGLLGYADDDGFRQVHAPLAQELARQQARF